MPKNATLNTLFEEILFGFCDLDHKIEQNLNFLCFFIELFFFYLFWSVNFILNQQVTIYH